jgi:Cytochrome oxidase complex assembly protein 1
MSTKKIVLIVVGVLAVLGLVVVLFAGGIVWFAFHTMSNSEAAETARTYLRNNEVLKQDVGEVKDFGSFVTGNINMQNGDGAATLYIKVIGERREAKTRVDLSYRSNRGWRVTGASYTRDGKDVDLMQGYGPPASSPN